MEKTPLNEDEVRELVGNRPIEQFLNPRSEIFRERRMKENLPGKEEAVKLMAEDANLILRPILVRGARIHIGFEGLRDQRAYRDLIA